MKRSSLFIQGSFFLLSILFITFSTVSLMGKVWTLTNFGIGITLGCVFCLGLIILDFWVKKVELRTITTGALGLFLGYLFGMGMVQMVNALPMITGISYSPAILALFRSVALLTSIYLGVVVTMQAGEQLLLIIPFVSLKEGRKKRVDILVDHTVLFDLRFVDFVATGIFDHRLTIPRFVLKTLNEYLESRDESLRAKGRRGMEVLKKLESLRHLHLKYSEKDFPHVVSEMDKLVLLARTLDASILTADINKIRQATVESVEGIRILNLNDFSRALKPLTHAGESMEIKIQRYGKEPGQGVGYLDDGTMVVVNGGAEYIGEVIRVFVLSIKHSASGRIVFCNASDEPLHGTIQSPLSEKSGEQKSYAGV